MDGPRALRLRSDLWSRAAGLIPELSRDLNLVCALGGEVTANRVLRLAVERGLRLLEEEAKGPQPEIPAALVDEPTGC